MYVFYVSIFFPCTENIREKGGRVLVHCYAGISRSATISISYLMLKNNWSMHQAFEFCRERRPCVSPNFNFMGQLLSFQQELSLCPVSPQEDVCPIGHYEHLVEENPSGPESLVKPCPKKRPGSLSLKVNESRSADNSPNKRAFCFTESFTRSASKLHTTAALSTSDSTLHCSDTLLLTTHIPTVTNRA